MTTDPGVGIVTTPLGTRGSKEDENHKNYQQTQIIATLHEISHNTTSEHNYMAFVTEGITNYTLHIVMSTETLYLR